ncbi:phosphatase PAP2 family protein [Sediminitomix flava]|uniref:PAP2 superfamily protein n=1 Tax=Sediminitomix flava TaxID=379075 RepID=A0A316A363_SEDFL|nr:hypothetical protein [Sediminitomix flava]PWJ44147.1 hypothetical protein BC781_101497 [Sediminitomix flava]
MQNKLAKLLSYILHPIFMPLWMTAMLFYFYDFALLINEKGMWFILGFIFVFSICLPLLWIWFMYKVGIVKSLQMPAREERRLPYLMMLFINLGLLYSFSEVMKVGGMVSASFAGISLVLLVLNFSNVFFKISAHSTSITGLLGIFLAEIVCYGLKSYHSFYLMMVLLIISGFVMSSRLLLKVHTLKQVWYGAFFGFVSGFLGVYLFNVLRG